MVWKNDQVTAGETEYILDTARECLNLTGDLVEMGCYRGDTSLLLAEVVENFNKNRDFTPDRPVENSEKKLYIYDSFEGLPEKSEADKSVLGESFTPGALGVSKREVKERFLRAGLKVPVIKKAWFSELTLDDMPKRIAFAFLDGDFYESIRDSLNLVRPLMISGGVILVHDYNNPALPGVRKAVEEWEQGKEIEIFESIGVIRV